MSDMQAVYKAIALEVQQQLAKQYPNPSKPTIKFKTAAQNEHL